MTKKDAREFLEAFRAYLNTGEKPSECLWMKVLEVAEFLAKEEPA